jgi:NADH-quinone oxidoreductase subunit J
MDPLSFWFGGALTLASALMVVTRRHAVASVMWLVMAFVGMSVLFFGMDAGFIGVIQILVYAGAILVLFLFVIMLLNLTPSGVAKLDRPRFTFLGLIASGAVIGGIVAVAVETREWATKGAKTDAPSGGQVLEVANQLFDRHLLPFEVASVLLLVAIVGSVVLSKRKLS